MIKKTSRARNNSDKKPGGVFQNQGGVALAWQVFRRRL